MASDPAVLSALDAYFADLAATRERADRKESPVMRSVAPYKCRRHLLIAYKLLRDSGVAEPAGVLRELIDDGYRAGRGEADVAEIVSGLEVAP